MPSTNSSSKAVVAYVPALHAGYISFLSKHPGADIYVLGKSFIDAFPRLNRDLRALLPEDAAAALSTLGFHAQVLEIPAAAETIGRYEAVILPDEDVSKDFAKNHLAGRDCTFENIFLRWDGQALDLQKETRPDRVISTDELDRTFMREAIAEGDKSADWWRQIGAVLVKDNAVILKSHIRYFPSDLALDIFGTPRSNVDFGQRPDVYISMHCEADIVATAARAGMSLEGASIYSSTFPCINCAFLVARSGIKKLYYHEGYAKLDSEDVLRSAGVEIIFVEP